MATANSSMKDHSPCSQKEAMIKGGQIISRVMAELIPKIKSGITTLALDAEATRLIREFGGELSFNKVPGYKHATCMSVNEVIVHGVPSAHVLKDGDVLKVDIGAYFGGYHVDYGDTFYVGNNPPAEISKFLEVGRKTLQEIIALAKKDVRIGLISSTIEKNIHGAGYKVVLDLTGHAVGKELHEEPLIPGFLDTDIKNTPRLKAGRAYALEVIYSMKDDCISYANNDGWSLRTRKSSQSACFENSLFIDENETIILVN